MIYRVYMRGYYVIIPSSTGSKSNSRFNCQDSNNEELGEKLIDICLVILGKAVKLTKTDMDDQLLEVVTKAINKRDGE